MIKKISVLVLVLVSIHNFAQQTNSSPYSGLGIGDELAERTVEEMSMGGVGTSSSNLYNLNFNNPASLSSLRLTTYTLADENRAMSFEDTKGKETSSNAYLSYLALGIPIGPKGFSEPKGGIAFGFQPKTTIGYGIESIVYDSAEEPIEASIYNGDGGTNRVFLGGGYEVISGFSIGVEAEYLFGTVEKSITNRKKDIQFGTKYEVISDVEGLSYEVGFIYEKKLKKNMFANFGANIGLESSLDSKGSEYLYTVSTGSISIPKDTILNETARGTYKTPLKTSIGISIGKNNKWSAGIDYSFREAIELTGNLKTYNPQLRYQAASSIAVGGYYIPRYNSISSYWDRVIYRWGFNFENTGMMVDGTGTGNEFTAIDQFGMSFGVGIPIGAQLSTMNLGFEFGQRGASDNGLVKEKFFNFRLGLTLGNKWFKPKKIY